MIVPLEHGLHVADEIAFVDKLAVPAGHFVQVSPKSEEKVPVGQVRQGGRWYVPDGQVVDCVRTGDKIAMMRTIGSKESAIVVVTAVKRGSYEKVNLQGKNSSLIDLVWKMYSRVWKRNFSDWYVQHTRR